MGVAGPPAVLAHQGGWDEALVLLAPVALFVVLLRVAQSRAAHTAHPAPTAGSDDAEQGRR